MISGPLRNPMFIRLIDCVDAVALALLSAASIFIARTRARGTTFGMKDAERDFYEI